MAIRSFDPESGLEGRHGSACPPSTACAWPSSSTTSPPRPGWCWWTTAPIDQFEEAAAWIAAQGIPIVSHSNSFLTPPFDGTGRAARAVDAAAAAGVLWVNSAGNYGQRHWRGPAAPGGTVLPIAPPAGTPLLFSLSWSAPGRGRERGGRAPGPGRARGSRCSAARPPGPGNAVTTPLTTDARRVAAGGAAGRGRRRPSSSLFSQTVGFGPLAVPDGSIPTPGDAAGALAVGAVNWTGVDLEPYSSQGPTAGGGPKPDLVAPDLRHLQPGVAGHRGHLVLRRPTSRARPRCCARSARPAGLPVDPAALRAALVGGALDLGPPGPGPALRRGDGPPRHRRALAAAAA